MLSINMLLFIFNFYFYISFRENIHSPQWVRVSTKTRKSQIGLKLNALTYFLLSTNQLHMIYLQYVCG